MFKKTDSCRHRPSKVINDPYSTQRKACMHACMQVYAIVWSLYFSYCYTSYIRTYSLYIVLLYPKSYVIQRKTFGEKRRGKERHAEQCYVRTSAMEQDDRTTMCIQFLRERFSVKDYTQVRTYSTRDNHPTDALGENEENGQAAEENQTFFKILLTHEGSHREVYRDFQPSLTSSAGGAKGWSDHRLQRNFHYHM